MKTIELQASAVSANRYAHYIGIDGIDAMLFGDIEQITDEPLILMSKKDYEKLLANLKEREDLPTNTPVMIRNCAYWALGLYKGRGKADDTAFTRTTAKTYWLTYDHIIPFSLFDPDNPDKWNGTENDYGTKGGAR